MSSKLTCLVSLAFVLCSVWTIPAEAADANLMGWWKLDGDGLDASGNGRNGTLAGDAHYEAGYAGQALALDGDADYFTVTGWKGLLSVYPVTVTAWVKTTASGDATMVYWGRNASPRRVDFRLGAGRLRVEHGSGNIQGDTSLNDDQWHHVALTMPAAAEISYPYVKLYRDGVDDTRDTSDPDAFNLVDDAANVDVTFGYRVPNGDRYFAGLLDEVRIYDRELSGPEIRDLATLGYLASPHSPSPGDGAKIEDTWGALAWTAGPLATSHDVYFSTSFDDVSNRAEAAFVGSLGTNSQPIGFSGFPAPDGLVPGTTYYWRVDEISDTHADSPWEGDVWSFWIPPVTAYDPVPGDGESAEPVDTDLSWSLGLKGILHAVYFGTDRDQVANAVGAPPHVGTTYDPGPLANATTYYWRVDTFNSAQWTPGPVWTFRTIPTISIADPNLVGWWRFDEGRGTKAIDWSGQGNHGTLIGPAWTVSSKYGDAALDFTGGGYVAIQNLSYNATDLTEVTVCAWIRTSSAGDQYIVSFDRDSYWRLEINGSGGDSGQVGWDVMTSSGQVDYGSVSRVDDGTWRHVCGVFDRGLLTIYIDGRPEPSTTGGSTFGSTNTRFGFIGANSEATTFDGSRGTGSPVSGEVDDVRIYHKALTQAEIRQVMLRPDLTSAWAMSPADGSTASVDDIKPLGWSPGDTAARHDVYFGTDAQAVANAAVSDTTGIYRGRQTATGYTPPETLEYLRTYYWRIDEVEADDTTIHKGDVWSFILGDYIVIDNFEEYSDYQPDEIWRTWVDGFGTTTNGAGVGYPEPLDFAAGEHYAETSIVHSGRQAMPYFYNNSVGYSEAKMTLSSSRDWTRQGVKALSLWFQGHPESVGSFTEGPAGTYTMTATGADIWGTADQFHFAFMQLSGPGAIVAKVERVLNTDVWAKAGVMIRQTLDAGSVHGMMVVTPAQGVAFQRRTTADATSVGTTIAGIPAPQWVKIERDVTGNITASYSADGVSWTQVGTELITMTTPVYIGLALTSHDNTETCEAVFSNVQVTGAAGQWSHQDIGILSNDPERMYVAISGANGVTGTVYHDDPLAARMGVWTEWNIDLKEFSNRGVNLANVASIAIGFGDRNNPQAGGSGKMYFDDIRLYRPRCVALLAQPAADLNNDCAVDRADIEIMADNWLIGAYDVTAVAPSNANLDAHYQFDGNLLDSSGNNYNGDPCGVVAYAAGVAGQALELRGTSGSSFVNVAGYPGVVGTQSRTVSAWIKTHLTGEIASWGQNVAGQKWIFRVQESNGVIGAIRIEVNGGYIVGSTDVRDEQWHHVAAILIDDGSPNVTEVMLYVDGVLEVVSDLLDGPINTAGDGVLRIGEAPWHTRPFTGQIDDLRIYSRVLSQGELASLAGVSEGATLRQPLLPTAAVVDLDGDERIDFKDFALLANQWLTEQLWP
ncbi:MAG TPA: LamG domain-containing protein [Sedimentisphaerales bacterium]|nr:LamG domain-containing protein [Sedimentisphaerales bacterium]